MITIAKVNYVNLIIAIILLTINSIYGKDGLGCQLIPSNIGNHKEQTGLLDNLRHHIKFGTTFTCSHDAKLGTKYEFAVCDDADKKKPLASVIRRNENEGTVDAIGMRNSVVVAGKDDWIYMKFGEGDKDSSGPCINTSLSSTVMILCDKDFSTPKFSLVYEETSYCHFLFELKAALFCERSQGLGGWTILFIILLVGFLVYFAAGLIYLRFVTGAKGINQIPHRQFWRMLGNKFADCCNAVCRCNQCCEEEDDGLHSPNSSGYSPIGETPNFPSNSSQRDAPLLHP